MLGFRQVGRCAHAAVWHEAPGRQRRGVLGDERDERLIRRRHHLQRLNRLPAAGSATLPLPLGDDAGAQRVVARADRAQRARQRAGVQLAAQPQRAGHILVRARRVHLRTV